MNHPHPPAAVLACPDAATSRPAERHWMPLSAAQRMVWLDLRLQADARVYQLTTLCHVEGLVDAATARQALQLLAARHDALRLRVDDEQPRQWLAESAALPMRLHELSAADVAARVAAIQNDVMSLGDCALAQVDLLQVASDAQGRASCEIVWRVSHLIVDYAGLRTLALQWVAIYNALLDEVPGELPRGSSFVTTLADEAGYAASPVAASDLAYWKQRFEGGLPEPVFERRSDNVESELTDAMAAAPQAALRWTVDGSACAQWRAACAQAGVTEQRALVALLALAVATRQDRRELALALALHGRDARTREVVGMLASVLLVRCRWQLQDSLKQAVRGIAQALDEDYRHARTPVAEISRALGAGTRGLARLFDISLSLVQAEEGVPDLRLGGAPLSVRAAENATIVPLALLVTQRPAAQAMDFELSADPQFLGMAEMRSLALSLQRTMTQFATRSVLTVAELEPVSDDERDTLLHRFNPAPTAYPLELTLHEHVAAQARATPSAVAVIDGALQLSYAELEAQSDTLARRIRHALRDTAQPEPVVAVALPRSAATVVALLATLKAQAVYLPLDLSHPEQRLQHLLDDAQAALLIDAAGSVTAGLNAPRLNSEDPDDEQREVPANTHPQRTQRLAYVIYTSGSTGQPKPVGVSHRAAVNLAFARRDGHDPIGAGDRVLAAISVGFDVSVGQLLLPLLSGAAIVIAPALRTLQAEAFWQLLAEHRVTHINSVPSFFDTVSEALQAMPEASRYRGLKRLMLGGEALTGALARKLQQRLPGTTVVNMYGPTEACIDATAYVVPDQGELPASLPIGRPLANYRAYVLDGLNRLCPIGVAGELCLAGEGLARGYLRRPEATAEKFGADPYSRMPGQRLYRTGDLARWNASGEIEFLGRNDQQVKIRGQRVETGEIEATLVQHAAVQQAAVIANKDGAGQTRLVAYLVGYRANDADSLAPDAIKRWLAQRLPEHMLPSAFVGLDALPLTTNGKLDRKALPQADALGDARREHAEPQGEVEAMLAALWAELLRQPRIGRDDHFFDLGGHSLLAISLVDRLRHGGLRVDVRAVFERPLLRELAAAVHRDEAADTDAAIPQADRRAPLPLSFAQERLWLLAQIDPQASLAYHIPGGVRLRGALDIGRLQRALNGVVGRHEALRTRFANVGGQARQIIDKAAAEIALPLLDVSAATDAQAELRHAALAEARAPFDLQRGPLLRARLLRLDADEHVLLITLHHIVADGWSIGVLVRELGALYAAPLHAPAALAPLAVQYADYAAWQRADERAERRQQQIAFWTQHLAGAPALIELPTDRPRPAQQDYRGATIAFTLDATLTQALKALAQRTRCTPFMVLLAGWSALLSRISGQAEVVVGTPVAQRTRAELEPLIGFFVNTLALRVDTATPSTPAELLAQVRATMLATQDHQDLPFAQLVDALRPPRSSAHSPVFQVLLSWLNTPPGSLELPGLAITPLAPVEDETPNAKFELSLELEPAGDTISGRLNYATALFDRATMQRHLGHLRMLLQAMASDETTPLARLPLLDAAEREQLLHRFNPAPVAFETGLIDALVRRQVQATPDLPAVLDGDLTMSYRELDDRSDALARRIRHALRDTPAAEPVVAVALPRSAATVVVLLAILKAGAVYLPLDIGHPTQRLQYMLDDAGAVLLIDADDAVTQALRAPRLRDAAMDANANADEARIDDEAAPSQHDDTRLAYAIYTSGSTGEPKAVGVSHRAAVNLSFARQLHDPIGPGSRVLAAISVGFDVSIGQLLLPLLRGAAIVIAPDLRGLDAAAFWALLARHDVTQINSVPSFFDTVSETLVALPPAQRYGGLQRLMLGGEALTGALASKLQQRLPGTQIVNMYGPTEACIDATAFVVPGSGEQPVALPASLPIGRPLPNYRAYVLDAHDALCPIGVAGELCLAGAGLARGYLGRPQATAEKFVADPYATQAGERMYRSGDMARWTADGQLEFLGRNDQQVKIRGQRVETGEIEAALLRQPAVQQAAVLARKDAAGQARLVAYLVVEPASEAGRAAIDIDALKHALAQGLPEHMLPSAFVVLDALPLTTNGKLDRQALPEPGTLAPSPRAHVAPQGEVEGAMAAAWQQSLGVAQVGRDDDFFDLGGHSLRAIALVEQLRQRGLRLDVPTLFAHPTLRAMAAACVPLDAAVDALTVPPRGIPDGARHITPAMLPMVSLTPAQIDSITAAVPGGAAAVQDIYPLAPLQQGMLFHHLAQAQGDVYLTPLISAFDTRAALDGFIAALQVVIARHDVLRSSFAWEGLAEPMQVVWRSAALALQWLEADSAVDTDALERLKAAVDPARDRLDLRRAPLLRAVALHDLAQGRWLLALSLHHLLLDHSSLDIVMQEVAAVQAGQGDSLPPSVPFRDLVWQARQGVSQQAHEDHFRAMLADVDEPTAPFGIGELAADAMGVKESVLTLTEPSCAALRTQARAAGASAASLMHLAWALVLARTSAGAASVRDDVVFGTVMFGRLNAAPGAERALGMLINTLPLRVRGGALAVRDALAATHASLTGLMRHEHAPLALAQRCSGVAAPAPLFTALFNFRHDNSVEGAHGAEGAPAGPAGMRLLWAQERTGYPLSLAVDDGGRALRLTVQAAAPLDARHIARLMSRAVEQIVHALQRDDGTRCDALDLVDDDERDTLLHRFNPAPSAYPLDLGLHEHVAAQARATPSAVAVIDGALQLSYAELEAQSDTLARRIRHALRDTAQPEPVVAVALPRSAATVVALLAILKAQAVYLPLDVSYPEQRLQHLLDDAQAALLIDEAGSVTAGLNAPRLNSEDPDDEQREVPANTHPQRTQRLAYVIYTSGSTGQPKPVGVSHRAAVNLAFARRDGHDPIGAGDRVLAAISVGFDVSVGQLLLPLLSGAAIVIAPALRTLQAEAFWQLLAEHRVTHINSVPSFFDTVSEALQAMPEASRYRGLKRLMLGGEALTGALARKLQQRLPGTTVVNMYGPTEACIDATAYVVPDQGELPASLPIGRPLANYRAYVLDGLNRLCPIGVAGELCLAGEGLARGYLRRPEATAEKFGADPYSTMPGQRLYRTGDLARWNASGEIEFLGRNDQQVKIRGQRVETGEIEATLVQHAAVQQAAVIANKDGAGQTRLVAYIVGYRANDADSLAPDAIKRWLAQRLPEHMLPSAFVGLDALPLTTNGKLDRKALPPADAAATSAAPYRAPRDAVETALQSAWQAVLGRERVGVDDDFFALGGHSLLALRLISACQMALREAAEEQAASRVDLRLLLARPSIAGITEAMSAADDDGSADGLPRALVALRSSGSRRPLFCVHPQSGSVWCFGELVRALPAELPVWGLQAQGLAEGETPLDSVPAMAAQYVAAMRAVQPQGPYRILGYSSGGVAAFEMAAQLRAAGAAVELLALLDSPLADGRDSRPATLAEVLDDAGRLLGVTRADEMPRGAAQLHALMQARGFAADAAPDVAQAATQRLLDTARAIVQATRAHVAAPIRPAGLQAVQASEQHAVQLRALKRDGAPSDWQALLPRGALRTVDLDCDHTELVGARFAAAVAQALAADLH